MMLGVYLEDDNKRVEVLKQLESLESFFDDLSRICGYNVKSLYSNLSLILDSQEFTIRPYFIIAHLVRESLNSMTNYSEEKLFIGREYTRSLMKTVPKEVIEKLERKKRHGIKFDSDRKTFTIKLRNLKLEYINILCHKLGFERSDWSGELREIVAEGIWAENVYKFKFFLKKNFKITKQELDEVAVRLRDSHAYLNKHAHLWQTHESVDDDEFYKQIILLLKIYQSLDLRDRSKIGLNKNLKSLANEGNNE